MAGKQETKLSLVFDIDQNSLKKAAASADKAFAALEGKDLSVDIDTSDLGALIKNLTVVQVTLAKLLSNFSKMKKIEITVDLNLDQMKNAIKEAIESAFGGAMIQSQKNIQKQVRSATSSSRRSSASTGTDLTDYQKFISQLFGPNIQGRSGSALPKDFASQDSFIKYTRTVDEFSTKTAELIRSINNLSGIVGSRDISSDKERSNFAKKKTAATGIDDFRFIPEFQGNVDAVDLFDLSRFRKVAASLIVEFEKGLSDPNLTKDMEQNIREGLRRVFREIEKIDIKTSEVKQGKEVSSRVKQSVDTFENAFQRVETARRELRADLSDAIASGDNSSLSQSLKRFERVTQTVNNALELNRRAQDLLRGQLLSAVTNLNQSAQAANSAFAQLSNFNAVSQKGGRLPDIVRQFLKDTKTSGGLTQTIEKDPELAEKARLSALDQISRLTSQISAKQEQGSEKALRQAKGLLEQKQLLENFVPLLEQQVALINKKKDAQIGINALSSQEQKLIAQGTTLQSETREARSIQRINDEQNKITERAFRNATRLKSELSALSNSFEDFAKSNQSITQAFDGDFDRQLRSFRNAITQRKTAVLKAISEINTSTGKELSKLNTDFRSGRGVFSGLSPADAQSTLQDRTQALDSRSRKELAQLNDELDKFNKKNEKTAGYLDIFDKASQKFKALEKDVANSEKQIRKTVSSLDDLRSVTISSGGINLFSASRTEDLIDFNQQIDLLINSTNSSSRSLAILKKEFRDLAGIDFDSANVANLTPALADIAKRIKEIKSISSEGVEFQIEFGSAILEIKNLKSLLESATKTSVDNLFGSSDFTRRFAEIKAGFSGTNQEILEASSLYKQFRNDLSGTINGLEKANISFNKIEESGISLSTEQLQLVANNKVLIKSLRDLQGESELQAGSFALQERAALQYSESIKKAGNLTTSIGNDINLANRAIAQVGNLVNNITPDNFNRLAAGVNIFNKNLDTAKKNLFAVEAEFDSLSNGKTVDQILTDASADPALRGIARSIKILRNEVEQGATFQLDNSAYLSNVERLSKALGSATSKSLELLGTSNRLSTEFQSINAAFNSGSFAAIEMAASDFSRLKSEASSSSKTLSQIILAFNELEKEQNGLTNSQNAARQSAINELNAIRALAGSFSELDRKSSVFDDFSNELKNAERNTLKLRSAIQDLGSNNINNFGLFDVKSSDEVSKIKREIDLLNTSVESSEKSLIVLRNRFRDLAGVEFDSNQVNSLSVDLIDLAKRIKNIADTSREGINFKFDAAGATGDIQNLARINEEATKSSAKLFGSLPPLRDEFRKLKVQINGTDEEIIEAASGFDRLKNVVSTNIKELSATIEKYNQLKDSTGSLTAEQSRLLAQNELSLSQYKRLQVAISQQNDLFKSQSNNALRYSNDVKKANESVAGLVDSVSTLKLASKALSPNFLSGGVLTANSPETFEKLIVNARIFQDEIDSSRKSLFNLSAQFDKLSGGRSVAEVLSTGKATPEILDLAKRINDLRSSLDSPFKLSIDSAAALADIDLLANRVNKATVASVGSAGTASRSRQELSSILPSINSRDASVVIEAADSFNRLKNEVSSTINELIRANRAFDDLAQRQGGLTAEQAKLATANQKEIKDLKELNSVLAKNEALVKQQEQLARNTGKSFSFYSTELSEQIKSNFRYANALGVVTTALFAIRTAFRDLVEESKAFARSLTVVQSVNLSTAASAKLLQERTREAAVAYGLSLSSVLEVQKQFGSAGFSLEESLRGLDSTLQLVVATSANAEEVAKSVAGVYRVFGDQLRSTYGELRAFGSIADTLTAVYRNNQAEISEVVNGLKFAGAAAATSGFSFEQTTGFLAVLNDNLIKSGTAGRALQVIFAQLANKSGKFEDAFGIKLDPNQTLNDQFLKLLEGVNARLKTGALTVADLEKRFKFFGLRGARAFITLTEKFDDVKKSLKNTEDGARGVANQLSQVVKDQLANKIDRAKQALLDFARQGLEPLGALVGFISNTLLGLRNTFAQFPIISKIIATLVILTGVIGSLIISMGALTVLFVTSFRTIQQQTVALFANTKAWLANASAQRAAAASSAVTTGATQAGALAQSGGVVAGLMGAGSAGLQRGKAAGAALGGAASRGASAVAGVSVLGGIGSLLSGALAILTKMLTVVAAIAGFFTTTAGIIVGIVAIFAVILAYTLRLDKAIVSAFGKLKDFFRSAQGIRDSIQQISAKANEQGQEGQRVLDFEKKLASLDEMLKNTAISQEAFGQQVREAFNNAGTSIVDTTKIALQSNEELAKSFKALRSEAQEIIDLNKKAGQNRGLLSGLDIVKEQKLLFSKELGLDNIFAGNFFDKFQENKSTIEEYNMLLEKTANVKFDKDGPIAEQFRKDVKRLNELRDQLGDFQKDLTNISQSRVNARNSIDNIQGLSPEVKSQLGNLVDQDLTNTINKAFNRDKFLKTDAGKKLADRVLFDFATEFKKKGGQLKGPIGEELDNALKDASGNFDKFEAPSNAFNVFSGALGSQISLKLTEKVDEARISYLKLVGVFKETPKLNLGAAALEDITLNNFQESFEIFKNFRMEFSQPFSTSGFEKLNNEFKILFGFLDGQDKAIANAKIGLQELTATAEKSGRKLSNAEIANKLGEGLSENGLALNSRVARQGLKELLQTNLRTGNLPTLLENPNLGIQIEPGTTSLLKKVGDDAKVAAVQSELLDDIVEQLLDKIFLKDNNGNFFESSIGNLDVLQVKGEEFVKILQVMNDNASKLGSSLNIVSVISSFVGRNNAEVIKSTQNKLINDQLTLARIAAQEKSRQNPLVQLDNQARLITQRLSVLETTANLQDIRAKRSQLVQQLSGDVQKDNERKKAIKELIDQETQIIELKADQLLAFKKIAQFEVKARNEIILSNQATQETGKFLLGNLGLKRSEAMIQEQTLQAKLKELDIDELLFDNARGRVELRATAIKEVNSLLQKQLQLVNEFRNETANETSEIFEIINTAKTALAGDSKTNVLAGFNERELSRFAKLNRISEQLRETEKLRGEDTVQFQSKTIALRKQQVDLLKGQLEDLEKVKKASEELDDLTDRRIDSLKALRKALQEIRAPFEKGVGEAITILNGDLGGLLDLATSSGQSLSRAFGDPKKVVDNFVAALKEGRANLNGLSTDSQKFGKIISENFQEERATVEEIQRLQVERFKNIEKNLNLARLKKDFKEVDKFAGELFTLGQDLFGSDPDQRIQFLRKFNELQEKLLKEREDAVQEIKIKFSIVNQDDFVRRVEIVRAALREAIAELTGFTDVSEPLSALLEGALKGEINLREETFTKEVKVQLDRFESLIKTLDTTISKLELGGQGGAKSGSKEILGAFDNIDDSQFSDRLKFYGELGRMAASNFLESFEFAFARANAVTDASSAATGTAQDSILNKAKEIISNIKDEAGKVSLLDEIASGNDQQIRKSKEELEQFLESIQPKIDFKEVFAKEFAALDALFLRNSREFDRFAKNILLSVRDNLLTVFDGAIASFGNKVKGIFESAFDLTFAFENAERFKQFIQELQDIDENFFNSVFDIQETLRRNESDYYSYINSIQDAEKQRIDARLAAEEQYRNELKKTADVFKESISKSLGSLFDFEDFNLAGSLGLDGAISSDLKLITGGFSVLSKVSNQTNGGEAAKNDIDFVKLKEATKTVEEKNLEAVDTFVESNNAFADNIVTFGKIVAEIPAKMKEALEGNLSLPSDTKSASENPEVKRVNERGDFTEDIGLEIGATIASVIAKSFLSLVQTSFTIISSLVFTLGNQILENGSEKVVKFVTKFVRELPNVVTQFVAEFNRGVPQIIDAFVEGLPTIVESLVEGIPTVVEQLINQLVTNGPKIAEVLLTGVVDLVENVVGVLGENAGAIADFQANILGSIIQAIPDIIGAILVGIVENIDTIVIALIKTYLYLQFGLLYDLITGLINKISGSSIGKFGDLLAKIPNKFHNGGYIGGNEEDMLIIAQSGEGVLSREGLKALGGISALNALNSGINPFSNSVSMSGNTGLQKFHSGGVVGYGTSRSAASSNVTNNSYGGVNLSLSVNSSGNAKADAKKIAREVKKILVKDKLDRKI